MLHPKTEEDKYKKIKTKVKILTLVVLILFIINPIYSDIHIFDICLYFNHPLATVLQVLYLVIHITDNYDEFLVIYK